ncbi:MAG: glycerol-3-phosphate 1-O-acyltransferase PlsY [Rhizomicrobium sp.]
MGVALALGYLLGSVPFGLIFGWLAGVGDVRNIGSGNIGATNVLRTGRRWAAAATLLCDAAKGALAVVVAAGFGEAFAVAAAIGAFLGHVFPVWLKFHGGKGVATFFGVVLTLDWRIGLLASVTWLLAAALFRVSSIAALAAAALTPVYFLFRGNLVLALTVALFAIVIFLKHRTNITRLVNGNEPRIGCKPSAS